MLVEGIHPYSQVMKSLDAAHNTLLGVPSPTEVKFRVVRAQGEEDAGNVFFLMQTYVFFRVGKYVNCN